MYLIYLQFQQIEILLNFPWFKQKLKPNFDGAPMSRILDPGIPTFWIFYWSFLWQLYPWQGVDNHYSYWGAPTITVPINYSQKCWVTGTLQLSRWGSFLYNFIFGNGQILIIHMPVKQLQLSKYFTHKTILDGQCKMCRDS